MVIELQHFVYSLYPNRGYNVNAWSTGIEGREWKSFCEPPPVEDEALKKLYRVWSMQKIRNSVILSLFTFEGKDEAIPIPRKGQYSHHIIVPIQEYLNSSVSPVDFNEYFKTDPNTIGELNPIIFNPEKIQRLDVTGVLANIKPKTLEKILFYLLKQDPFTLICPNSDTKQMLELASSLLKILPPDKRIIPFITAPLDRRFKKERGDTRFQLKIVQEHYGIEESINITEDNTSFSNSSENGKIAQIIVNRLQQNGMQGTKELFNTWEEQQIKNPDVNTQANTIIASSQVKEGTSAISKADELLKRGKKEEAAQVARVMIDTREWRDTEELGNLFRVLFSNKKNVADTDIALLFNELDKMAFQDSIIIVNILVNNLPGISEYLITQLKKRYSIAYFTKINDFSSYPAIESQFFNTISFSDFESLCFETLKNSSSDSVNYNKRLGYFIEKSKQLFNEHIIDFMQFLINSFPESRKYILSYLKPEDLIPNSIVSHVNRDIKQLILMQSLKIWQLLEQSK